MDIFSPDHVTKAIRLTRRMQEKIATISNRFLDFFTPRRTRRLAVGLLTAFLLVVMVTARAEAQTDIPDKVGAWMFSVLNTILLALIQMVGQLASMIVSLLVAISQWNKFTTVKVVDVGWTIVKDVSNMLFIIALMVIAAGTVLRLENYKYNRLLSNLIIMAFLTNFSKFIAAFFIQGAQVLMLTFVNAYKEALFGNFVSAFGLDQILKFRPDAATLTQGSVFGNLLAGLILTVIALIITAAICVVLFARVVALWILVILSPFAFASQILPNTKSFASRWWSEFGKYVTQGPILAFFLWLALAIVSVGNGASSVDPKLGEIAAELESTQGSGTFFQMAAFTFDNIMTFVISGAFLMFGLQYATSSSGAAGKWAGKVAAAGFAGAATVSGINAIRDRTIAPVQGWIKNRGAARQAAIQERTQTLEAAGDRVRAAVGDSSIGVGRFRIGPGQKGADKAQAAANAYERQRTQRVIQGQGFNDMSTAVLQDRMNNSRDQRERLAALQTLQSRGAVNLGNTAQRASFNDILANQRLPAGEKKKLREELLGNHAKGLNGDELRKELAASTTKDDRIIFARRLQEVNALKVGNTADEQIVKNLRTDLADSPDKLRTFDETMMKTNQDMAKKVLFNDLATVEDRRNLLLAVQQKQISASVLNKDTQKKFATAADGKNQEGEISRFLVENSRDEASLRGFYNQMDPEAAREIFSHVDMRDEASTERRAMVAEVTGEMGKAFTDATNTYMESEALKYADSLGGEQLAKNISVDSLKDAKVLKTLNSSANMKFPHWESIRNRNKETRGALAEGLGKYADTLQAASPDGKIDLDPKNGNFKENNFVVQNLAYASKGKDLRHDLTSDSGKRAYESLVRSGKAADLADLNESNAFKDAATRKYMTQTYGMHADPAKIADMLQFENFDFAEEALKESEAELTERVKGGDMKAFSRLTQMARHPVLSAYIATPEKPNKKGGDVGVAGAVGAGAIGRASGESEKGEKRTKDDEKPDGTEKNPKRRQAGFTAKWDDDSSSGPETGGSPAPVVPPKPRGPSGVPQNILIGTLNPEQRQARQEVIKIRKENRGRISDADFAPLAEKILQADDLKKYKQLSAVPASVLSDDDRKLLQEYYTQLGVTGLDVREPLDGLTREQLQIRQEIVDARKNDTRILDMPERVKKILTDEEHTLFEELRNRKPDVGRSPEEEVMLKNLNKRVGFIEDDTE